MSQFHPLIALSHYTITLHYNFAISNHAYDINFKYRSIFIFTTKIYKIRSTVEVNVMCANINVKPQYINTCVQY